jgi:high-affinity K+ transport system ATPase subunit B
MHKTSQATGKEQLRRHRANRCAWFCGSYAVTAERSDQLSYVPRLFFNNLVIRHIESSGSQLSLASTISLLWTQFWASVDTTWTPKSANQQRNLVYQMRKSFGVHLAGANSRCLLGMPHRRHDLRETNHCIGRDGEIIEGVASVDESAITGESPPVAPESGPTGSR